MPCLHFHPFNSIRMCLFFSTIPTLSCFSIHNVYLFVSLLSFPSSVYISPFLHTSFSSFLLSPTFILPPLILPPYLTTPFFPPSFFPSLFHLQTASRVSLSLLAHVPQKGISLKSLRPNEGDWVRSECKECSLSSCK